MLLFLKWERRGGIERGISCQHVFIRGVENGGRRRETVGEKQQWVMQIKPHSLLICYCDATLSLMWPPFPEKRSQNMYLLVIITMLPSVTCKWHFKGNISFKYRKYRQLPFSQPVAPSVLATPVCLHAVTPGLWNRSPPSLLHTRSSIQPSQPPTHSLGMNRNEKLSCIIKCAKALLNMTALNVEEFYLFIYFLGGGSRMLSVHMSKRLPSQSWGVMCQTSASLMFSFSLPEEVKLFDSVRHHCQTLSPLQRLIIKA